MSKQLFLPLAILASLIGLGSLGLSGDDPAGKAGQGERPLPLDTLIEIDEDGLIEDAVFSRSKPWWRRLRDKFLSDGDTAQASSFVVVAGDEGDEPHVSYAWPRGQKADDTGVVGFSVGPKELGLNFGVEGDDGKIYIIKDGKLERIEVGKLSDLGLLETVPLIVLDDNGKNKVMLHAGTGHAGTPHYTRRDDLREGLVFENDDGKIVRYHYRAARPHDEHIFDELAEYHQKLEKLYAAEENLRSLELEELADEVFEEAEELEEEIAELEEMELEEGEEFYDAVDDLRDEVGDLRDAIDDLRDEVGELREMIEELCKQVKGLAHEKGTARIETLRVPAAIRSLRAPAVPAGATTAPALPRSRVIGIGGTSAPELPSRSSGSTIEIPHFPAPIVNEPHEKPDADHTDRRENGKRQVRF